MSIVGVEEVDSGISDLLAQVDFTAAELRHPVEGLTVEMAATEAAVSVTTVDSAITSATAFRKHVLLGAIRSVETTPGPEVWDALQASVGGSPTEPTLEPIFAARSRQLAADPGFPLFLSGFEQLDDTDIALAIEHVLARLVSDWWPFLRTACSAAGSCLPAEPSVDLAFTCQLLLLSDGLQRALVPPLDGDGQGRMSRALAAALTAALFRWLESEHGTEMAPQETTLADDFSPVEPVAGLAAEAVLAGVEILRTGAVRPSTNLGVAEAARRSGLSVAGFYRSFGSIAEFDRQLLDSVGSSLSDGFRDEFFRDVLASVETDSRGMRLALTALTQHVTAQQRRHVEAGRPGIELVPWLNSPIMGPSIRASFASRFLKRGDFYKRFMELTGTVGVGGLRPEECAAVTGAVSIVVEFLIRRSPDPLALEAHLAGREKPFFANLLAPSS